LNPTLLEIVLPALALGSLLFTIFVSLDDDERERGDVTMCTADRLCYIQDVTFEAHPMYLTMIACIASHLL
jgi:hypothetical protein